MKMLTLHLALSSLLFTIGSFNFSGGASFYNLSDLHSTELLGPKGSGLKPVSLEQDTPKRPNDFLKGQHLSLLIAGSHIAATETGVKSPKNPLRFSVGSRSPPTQ